MAFLVSSFACRLILRHAAFGLPSNSTGTPKDPSAPARSSLGAREEPAPAAAMASFEVHCGRRDLQSQLGGGGQIWRPNPRRLQMLVWPFQRAVLEFLQFLLDEGRSLSTLRGYLAATSCRQAMGQEWQHWEPKPGVLILERGWNVQNRG